MSVVIDGYTIDAALRETHSREAEISDYPVEEGADVTDNVRARPKSVEIEGIVSDTPIGAMATLRGGATGSASPDGELLFLPSDEALAKLEAIFAARAPVTVETSAKTYENMVLVSLEVPRDISTGEALRFTASFREIILVQVNRTTVRVSSPSGAARKNAGNHTYKTLSDLAKLGVLQDGPGKGGFLLDGNGKPWTGLHWDAAKGAYADEDGQIVVSKAGENATYWDSAEEHFKNSDGSDVTATQMVSSTITGSSITPNGSLTPWWQGGGG